MSVSLPVLNRSACPDGLTGLAEDVTGYLELQLRLGMREAVCPLDQ